MCVCGGGGKREMGAMPAMWNVFNPLTFVDECLSDCWELVLADAEEEGGVGASGSVEEGLEDDAAASWSSSLSPSSTSISSKGFPTAAISPTA